MKIHKMEQYHISTRLGRSEPTGGYEITRNGNRRAVTKFMVSYITEAGTIAPKKWLEIARMCVTETKSENLYQNIIRHISTHCVWLKTNAEKEEYALDILLGRIYRHWKDFSLDGATEHTAFVFEF